MILDEHSLGRPAKAVLFFREFRRCIANILRGYGNIQQADTLCSEGDLAIFARGAGRGRGLVTSFRPGRCGQAEDHVLGDTELARADVLPQKIQGGTHLHADPLRELTDRHVLMAPFRHEARSMALPEDKEAPVKFKQPGKRLAAVHDFAAHGVAQLTGSFAAPKIAAREGAGEFRRDRIAGPTAQADDHMRVLAGRVKFIEGQGVFARCAGKLVVGQKSGGTEHEDSQPRAPGRRLKTQKRFVV